jgi:hypothetical protein
VQQHAQQINTFKVEAQRGIYKQFLFSDLQCMRQCNSRSDGILACKVRTTVSQPMVHNLIHLGLWILVSIVISICILVTVFFYRYLTTLTQLWLLVLLSTIYCMDNMEDFKQIISYNFLHYFNCESSVWVIRTFLVF